MSVLTPLTLHLAVALGVYAIAASLGLLLMPAARTDRLFDEMAESPALILGYGVIAFAIGAAWVTVHRDWMTPLGIIISLSGWWIALEGVALLASPALMVGIARALRPQIRLWSIIAMVIGALLILAGVTGIADAGGALSRI